jgi:hypothetical protein
MTYNYRDSSGQIGFKTQADRDDYQRSFTSSDRSGAISSLQDSPKSVQQSGTQVKSSSATYRNGLIELS